MEQDIGNKIVLWSSDDHHHQLCQAFAVLLNCFNKKMS